MSRLDGQIDDFINAHMEMNLSQQQGCSDRGLIGHIIVYVSIKV